MFNLLPFCRIQIVYDKIHEKPPFQQQKDGEILRLSVSVLQYDCFMVYWRKTHDAGMILVLIWRQKTDELREGCYVPKKDWRTTAKPLMISQSISIVTDAESEGNTEDALFSL